MLIKGRYEVREIIGSGGMGKVYRAFDREVGREVAIKSLTDIDNAKALQLFRREWRLIANLNHANIIEIYDSGEYEENGQLRPFFVMPLLRGQTLGQTLALSNGPLPADRVVDLAVRVAEGLQAIHELQLVHRDIKPSNIFILNNGSVKLIDFGIVQLAGGTTGLVIGTDSYMSPEQTSGGQCTPSSDLFSLAVVCYECLTRTRPFIGQDQVELFRQIRESIAAPVHLINPAVPPAVSKVIAKAMAKRPQHRWSSASEFALMLAKALRNEPIEALDPARIQTRVERARSAFELENFELARDVLRDIEEAGFVDPQVGPLRFKADAAIREREIAKRIESAERGILFEEFELALDEVTWVLRSAPTHSRAQELKRQLEEKMTVRRLNELFSRARRELAIHDYPRARHSLEQILATNPSHNEALFALQELAVREEAYKQKRREKDDLYKASREAFDAKEFASAAAKLRRVLELESEAPETGSGSSSNFREFLAEAERAQAAVEHYRNEIKSLLAAKSFPTALQVAKQAIAAFPGHPLFVGLCATAEEGLATTKALRYTDFMQRASSEEQLERRLSILQEAAREFPQNREIELWTQKLQDRLAAIRDLAAKAKLRADQGHGDQAEEKSSFLVDIYPFHAAASDSTRIMPAAKALGAAAGASAPAFAAGLSLDKTMHLPSPAPGGEAYASPAVNRSAPAGLASASVPAVPSSPPQVEARSTPAARPPATSPSPSSSLSAMASRAVASLRQMPPRLAGYFSAFRSRGSGLDWARLGPAPFSQKRIQIAVGACVLLLVVGSLYSLRGRAEKAPPPTPANNLVSASVQGLPSGAIIEVDGARRELASGSTLPLGPGTHAIRVRKSGYQSFETNLEVSLDASPPVLIVPVLKPLETKLTVIADWDGAQVKIGDLAAGVIAGKRFDTALPSGTHDLLIAKDGALARLSVEIHPAAPPKVLSIGAGQSTIVSASFGNDSDLWTNVNGIRTAENELLGRDQPLRIAGPRTVEFVDGKNVVATLALEPGEDPKLTVHLFFNNRIGSLRVCSNQDEFSVSLDGSSLRLPIVNRCMTLHGQSVGEHSVRLLKDGFESELRPVLIRPREIANVSLELKEVPKLGSLRISAAPPGAEIRVDGQSVGRASSTGTLEVPGLRLAPHKVDISLSPRFKPRLGITVAPTAHGFDALDGRLEIAPVNVEIAAPPDALVKWRCGSESASETRKATWKFECPEGPLLVSVSKDGFDSFESNYSLSGRGGTAYPVPVALREKPRSAGPAALRSCETKELLTAGFVRDGSAYRASTDAALPCADLRGRYSIALRPSRSFVRTYRRIAWSVAGAKFSIDGKKFTHPGGAIEISLDKIDRIAIQIELGSNSIQQQVLITGFTVPPFSATRTAPNAKVPIIFEKDTLVNEFRFAETTP
jgi:serine/threonine-protein kinase